MERRFVTVDVFTKARFGGNQLAVVLDAQGLETREMQAIAFEFNYAETTFVLPPKDPAHTAEVRIFTPQAEMPFAGHPNVGTAFVVATQGELFGKPIGGKVVFEEKAGLVPIEILAENGAVTGARLQAPKTFTRGESFDPAPIAAAIHLPASAITTTRHAPALAAAGITFLIAELDGLESLNAAAPDSAALSNILNFPAINGLYIYAPDGSGCVDFQSRMFAPDIGVLEDAATGSAAVALIGLLASLDPVQDGAFHKSILQGVKLGRPSYLDASATKSGGEVTATIVGGRCVTVMRGVLVG